MGCHVDPNNGFFVLNESPRERVLKLDSVLLPVLVTNDNNRTRPVLLVSAADGQAKVRYLNVGKKKKNEEVVVERSQVKFPFPQRDGK